MREPRGGQIYKVDREFRTSRRALNVLSVRAGLSEQATSHAAERPGQTPHPKFFKKVVDARVTTRLIYPLRDGPVAQLVRASG